MQTLFLGYNIFPPDQIIRSNQRKKMSDAEIDAQVFERRLAHLFDHYDKHKETLYDNCSVFQIFMGKVEENEKSEYALHKLMLLWLIGYEFTDTAVILEPKTRNIHFYTR